MTLSATAEDVDVQPQPAHPPLDAVIVEALTCRFGRTLALDAVSFRVRAGGVTGLLGPNGAGKTTVMDVVCGLLRPTSGRVAVFGLDVAGNRRRVSRRIGVVPQETALYDELSPRENLRFAAALYEVERPEPRIDDLLALVGLEARARDRCDHLSGGMRRRLAIARALVHQPELLILDEPTLGVDVDARHEIWRHLRSLRAAGTSVLLATNYLDEAAALCNDVVVLRAGRLVVQGAPEELMARAGRCVELDCAEEDVQHLAMRLRQREGVLRVDEAPATVYVYLDGSGSQEQLVHAAGAIAPLAGFRTRAPDLAEVLRALNAGGA